MAYTDDGIACGTDFYGYNAMISEGHDARLLSFPGGKHKNPEHEWAWKVGCLGITDSCSAACEDSFKSCSNSQSFSACESDLQAGRLSSCKVGCAPTLDMLSLSEQPEVSLSEGKFGTQTGLPVASNPPPEPKCKSKFGTFAEAPSGTCTPSSADAAAVAPSNPPKCGQSSAPPSPATPAPEPGPAPAPKPGPNSSPTPVPTPSPPGTPTPAPVKESGVSQDDEATTTINISSADMRAAVGFLITTVCFFLNAE